MDQLRGPDFGQESAGNIRAKTSSPTRPFSPSYTPSAQFLRQVIDPAVREVSAEVIKNSAAPATVYRLHLSGDVSLQVPTVVAKQIRPDWPGDPSGHEREALFYTYLMPGLDLPCGRIYFAGPEPDSDNRLLIMEDLSGSHLFPARSYLWSWEDARAVLNSYARLHHRGQRCLPPSGERAWLFARHEQRLLATAGDLPRMNKEITAKGLWPPVPRFDALLEATLSAVKQMVRVQPTLIHNDVYTPNLGLPRLAGDEVIILDWEMVGWGLAEMDLAFMFMQPFGSHRRLDRTQSLDYYWRQREKLGTKSESSLVREARQRYADALWTLWLVPVAHQMALQTHPPGSAVEVYWRSMFRVVGERLRTLSHAL